MLAIAGPRFDARLHSLRQRAGGDCFRLHMSCFAFATIMNRTGVHVALSASIQYLQLALASGSSIAHDESSQTGAVQYLAAPAEVQ